MVMASNASISGRSPGKRPVMSWKRPALVGSESSGSMPTPVLIRCPRWGKRAPSKQPMSSTRAPGGMKRLATVMRHRCRSRSICFIPYPSDASRNSVA